MKVATIPKLISWLLQRVPIHELAPILKSSPEITTYSAQEIILSFIQKSDIIALNPYYVRSFLKKYIDLIEKDGEEIVEELYEIFCGDLLCAKELDVMEKDGVRYYVGGFEREQEHTDSEDPLDVVTIYETPRLLSGINTTGHRTWEAALYLANYLNSGIYNWQGKTILELGGGTGLLSLAIRNQPLKEIIITDGSAALIDNLGETLHGNASAKTPIKGQQLLWGTTNKSQPEFIQEPPANVDVLVAADVTYDSSILDALASTVSDFFQAGTSLALIAATVRNEDTIKDWETVLNKWFPNKWSVSNRSVHPESIDSLCWFKKGTPEIRVYEIIQ